MALNVTVIFGKARVQMIASFCSILFAAIIVVVVAVIMMVMRVGVWVVKVAL